jgi:UDP-N-acetylglucosamine transferase subunit ALG13
MILVTVGTHEQPFDRLVSAAAGLAALDEVLVQRGVSRVAPAGCEVVDQLAPDALADAMRRARVVIAHAGPATLFEAGDAGHVPIVVPRDPAFGEHVDDHQLRFARRLIGRLPVVFDPADLVEAARHHEERAAAFPAFRSDGERTSHFAADVEALCARLVAGERPRRTARDTLRALSRWVSLRR